MKLRTGCCIAGCIVLLLAALVAFAGWWMYHERPSQAVAYASVRPGMTVAQVRGYFRPFNSTTYGRLVRPGQSAPWQNTPLARRSLFFKPDDSMWVYVFFFDSKGRLVGKNRAIH